MRKRDILEPVFYDTCNYRHPYFTAQFGFPLVILIRCNRRPVIYHNLPCTASESFPMGCCK